MQDPRMNAMAGATKSKGNTQQSIIERQLIVMSTYNHMANELVQNWVIELPYHYNDTSKEESVSNEG
jgi:hypothetical protein